MMTFAPKLEILPLAQQRLWPELAGVPRDFVLYGGTAIALRLGHRSSVDSAIPAEALIGRLAATFRTEKVACPLFVRVLGAAA